jgi:hypothetical protein
MDEVSGAALAPVFPIKRIATAKTQRVASERFTLPPF